jgi:hypothetical protein
MKAHRRVAKNTALIECVQVAAGKANWPISADAMRQSSLTGGGGARAEIPETPIDENGRIGRPETRGGRPVRTLPAGATRIALSKQPIMEGSTDARAKPAAVPQYQPQPSHHPEPVEGSRAAPARTEAPSTLRQAQGEGSPPPPAAPSTQHGATRFSSLFGTRRR